MPHFNPPTSFPGLDKLPESLQGLIGSIFPQSPDMPTPSMSALSGPVGAIKGLVGSLGKRGAGKVAQRGSSALQGASLRSAPSQTPIEADIHAIAGLKGSAQDILNPTAQKIMQKMYQEANPVFKKMQAEGQFLRGEPYPLKADAADEVLDELYPVSKPTPAWEGLKQIQQKLGFK